MRGVAAGRGDAAAGFDRGRLDDDAFAGCFSGQLDFHDADADELHDGVLSIVAGTRHAAEHGHDPFFSANGVQFVFDPRANARVAIEPQCSLVVEFQFAAVVFEILGRDAFHDLPRDIGRAVVAAPDIDRAAIPGRPGSLRIKVDFKYAV